MQEARTTEEDLLNMQKGEALPTNSNMFVPVALVMLIIFITLRAWRHQLQQGLPPGEMGIPVLGVAPFAGRNIYSYIEKLRHKHGNIFSMKLGHHLAVVLSDYDIIKSVMSNTDLQGRPNWFSFNLFGGNVNRGTAFSVGDVHLAARRHTMRYLRDFGMGKSLAEDIIQNQVLSLLKELEKKVDIPTDFNSVFCINVAVLNVIWKMVADRQFDVSDDGIQKFCSGLNEDFQITQGPMVMLDLFPWIIPFVPSIVKNKWMKLDHVIKNMDERFDLYKESIKEHIANLDLDNPRDLLDAYLIEMERTKGTSEKHYETLDDIMMNMDNMFIAGMETISSTMRWALIYMCMHPEVQQRVQGEIDQALPRDMLPTLQHSDRLPYCRAVINEVHRKASFFPLSLPHSTTNEIHINGYTIPKDTLVLINTNHCHWSPKHWSHPQEFHPEHFLDDEGRFIMKKDGFLPFSIGRRQCLGEVLARSELFLFFVSIMQKFSISPAPGAWPTENCDPTSLFVRLPVPFKFILKLRELEREP